MNPEELQERLTLARQVIGETRWDRLTELQADRLALAHGMPLDRARRYAAALMDVLDPWAVLSPGQTWSRSRTPEPENGPAKSYPAKSYPAKSYTVHGFATAAINGQVMADIGGGARVSLDAFGELFLTEWPAEHTLDDPAPQPPAGPIEPTEPAPTDVGETEDDEEQFDPRAVWFLVTRSGTDGEIMIGLPLLSPPYRAVNWHKPAFEPSYGNALDTVAYIAEHLADFRAAWPDYRDQWSKDSFFGAFNELDGGCQCDVKVAAYIGWWLWQRVRADVVAEHGGTVDDYQVSHMWSPGKADRILAAAPYADPEWEIPPDHPLAQCAGQDGLFAPEVTTS